MSNLIILIYLNGHDYKSDDQFSLTLYKCWAERGSETFEFWNQFCPLFSFVAPHVVDDVNIWINDLSEDNQYLNVAWDRKTLIHSVNFRNLSYN